MLELLTRPIYYEETAHDRLAPLHTENFPNRLVRASKKELKRFASVDTHGAFGYFPGFLGAVNSQLVACQAFAERYPSIVYNGKLYDFSFLLYTKDAQEVDGMDHLDCLAGTEELERDTRIQRVVFNLGSRAASMSVSLEDPWDPELEYIRSGATSWKVTNADPSLVRQAVIPGFDSDLAYGRAFDGSHTLHGGASVSDRFSVAFTHVERLEDRLAA